MTVFAPALVLAVLFGAWELYVALDGIEPLILPAPSAIAEALADDRALLWDNLVVTAGEIVLGLAVAVIVALAIVVAMHFSGALRKSLYPLVIGSQMIPFATLAPLLVYWLGFGLGPKLVVIAIVCFFPIVFTTLHALGQIDPDLPRLMRTLDASRWQTFRRAEAPWALPGLFSGLRIAVVIAGIAAVFAEYTGSEKGLGHLMLVSIPQLETARAYAAVTLLSWLAIGLFLLLIAAERRLLPWTNTRRDDS